MKQHRIEIITEFLIEQMNHWMLFAPSMMVMGLASGVTGASKPDWLMWALTGIIPFLYFGLRIRLKHFGTFLAAEIFVTVLCFIIPATDICSRVLCVLCTAGGLIYSFVLRLKSNSPYTAPIHPAAAVGLSFFSLILLHHQGLTAWDSYCFLSLIGTLALYFIIYYLKHYLQFLTVNRKNTDYLPAGEMLRSGLGLVLGYTLFGIAVVLLGSHLTQLEKLGETLKKAFFALLRAFFSLFHAEEGQQKSLPDKITPPTLGDAVPLPPEEEPFWLWNVLEIIFAAVLICVLLYGAVRLILWLIRFIRERFALGLERKPEEPFENSSDIREKCAPEKEKRAAANAPFRFFSPQARIRKIYKRKLLSSTAQLGNCTPTGLALLTARDSQRALQLRGMADIYEQARYSDRKMTNEDVKGMKAACTADTNFAGTRKD